MSSTPDDFADAEDTPSSSARIVRVLSKRPVRVFLGDSPKSPSPMSSSSMQSPPQKEKETAEPASTSTAGAAVVPDIPRRVSSRRAPTTRNLGYYGSETPVTPIHPALVERARARNLGLSLPRHGPINPNSIQPRVRMATIDEVINDLQQSYTPERLESSVNRRHSLPSALKYRGPRPQVSTAASIHPAGGDTSSLPPLQTIGGGAGAGAGIGNTNNPEPLAPEDVEPGSFDLVSAAPLEHGAPYFYSLEDRSELLFSRDHLAAIFADPQATRRLANFLRVHRPPSSLQLLVYYLDALKARKAVAYSNAILEALDPLEGHDELTGTAVPPTRNAALEERVDDAFDALVRGELPAYVTHTWGQIVRASVRQRVIGAMPPLLADLSEGLAEVFCLTDPSRADNPIVFASEEFHRTTQYGKDYAIGRNCRFLQGPGTNPFGVQRIRDKLAAGREHYETLLNYRRDGSPFMNLLLCAPLLDSRGDVRYFLGAQVDVSGLAKDCSGLEALQRLVEKRDAAAAGEGEEAEGGREEEEVEEETREEFRDLSAMFNVAELETARKHGGSMYRTPTAADQHADTTAPSSWQHKPRIIIRDEEITTTTPRDQRRHSMPPERSPPATVDPEPNTTTTTTFGNGVGRLAGVYENYLLVRPHPSLRILFASPALRIPGILQSPFLSKIGGSSPRVREKLAAAFAGGTGVITARVWWSAGSGGTGSNRNSLDISNNSKSDFGEDNLRSSSSRAYEFSSNNNSRPRWIHCTPLLGSNGAVGVWMVVLVDEDEDADRGCRMRPPHRRARSVEARPPPRDLVDPQRHQHHPREQQQQQQQQRGGGKPLSATVTAADDKDDEDDEDDDDKSESVEIGGVHEEPEMRRLLVEGEDDEEGQRQVSRPD